MPSLDGHSPGAGPFQCPYCGGFTQVHRWTPWPPLFYFPTYKKKGEKYDEKSSRLEVEQEVTHQISSWVPIIITGKTDLA